MIIDHDGHQWTYICSHDGFTIRRDDDESWTVAPWQEQEYSGLLGCGFEPKPSPPTDDQYLFNGIWEGPVFAKW